MNNNNSSSGIGGVDIFVGEDGILRVTIGASLEGKDVEQLINEAINLSRKMPGGTKILVNFASAPHIPSFIFRKQIIATIKKALKEIKNWRIAVYGGGTIQKTVASFVARSSSLENIRFLNNEEDALKWLKEEN